MYKMRLFCVIISIIALTLFLGVGYSSLTDPLSISGSGEATGPLYDVYISSATVNTFNGSGVEGYFGTTVQLKISSASASSFSITVANRSDKTYVFERVITGAETNLDGIYSGTDIGYTLTGLNPLQEIEPNGGKLTFELGIKNPTGITTEKFYLKFNFIEKTGTEILPGNPDEPDSPVDPDTPVVPDPDEPEPPVNPDPPTDEYHSDFLGLTEALLSDSNNCLNNSDVIFDAVIETLTANKRPDEDAPILHCQVNSISGGTMSAVAEYANSKLSKNLHFVFEADSDPNYTDKRMFLYMYYGNECTVANTAKEILVYKQVVTRGDDGIWFADGTYIGRATVGHYYGGGNNGKDVLTISPYTWKSGAPETV